MKTILKYSILQKIALLLMLCFCAVAQAQTFQWTNSVYNIAAAAGDNAGSAAVAFDQAGNLISTGWVRGSVDIGGTSYAAPTGGTMGMVVKYNPAGAVLWVKQCRGAIFINDVETDAAGNVYALGFFNDTLHLDNLTIPITQGDHDYFIAKWSAAGQLIWATNGGGSGARYPERLSIDQAGDLVISGAYRSVSNFGSIVLSPAIPSSFRTSLFVAKYNASGSILWAKGSVNIDTAAVWISGLGTDQDNNVYLTGTYMRSFSMGNYTLAPLSGVERAFFWIKLNSAGQCVSAQSIQPSRYFSDPQLAVDPSGYSYLSAPFGGTVDLGGITLTSASTPTGPLEEGLVARYDPNGVLQWAKQITGDYTELECSQVDNEKVYIAGTFRLPAVCGPVTLTSVGDRDAFVMAFDKQTGTPLWGLSGGGASNDAVYGMSVTPAGQVALCGTALGVTNFGSTTTGSQATLTNNYWFTSKILPNSNTISGTVFLDANSNGLQDATETGYQSASVVQASPGPLFCGIL